MPHNRKIDWRGRMYWKPEQVRVWLHNGHMIDLGPKSLEKCRVVAKQFGYTLIVQGELAGSSATPDISVTSELASASALGDVLKNPER